MWWVPAIIAGITAIGAFASSEQQRVQRQQQANQLEAQAAQLNADMQTRQANAEIEQANLDLNAREMRRRYNQEYGNNINLLGAGNVDISSGSALSLLEGNALSFASDIENNKYQRALASWSAKNDINAMRTQQENLYETADWYSRSSSSMLPSIMNGLLLGGLSFGSNYLAMGGKMFNSSGSQVQGVKNYLSTGQKVAGNIKAMNTLKQW